MSSSSSTTSPTAASPVAAPPVALPVAPSSVIAPQTLPVEDAIPPDFDTLLANFTNVPVVEAAPIVPGIVAPSWCEGVAARKHAYLIDLSKNHHYRLIVDWYIAQKVHKSYSFYANLLIIYVFSYLRAPLPRSPAGYPGTMIPRIFLVLSTHQKLRWLSYYLTLTIGANHPLPYLRTLRNLKHICFYLG